MLNVLLNAMGYFSIRWVSSCRCITTPLYSMWELITTSIYEIYISLVIANPWNSDSSITCILCQVQSNNPGVIVILSKSYGLWHSCSFSLSGVTHTLHSLWPRHTLAAHAPVLCRSSLHSHSRESCISNDISSIVEHIVSYLHKASPSSFCDCDRWVIQELLAHQVLARYLYLFLVLPGYLFWFENIWFSHWVWSPWGNVVTDLVRKLLHWRNTIELS